LAGGGSLFKALIRKYADGRSRRGGKGVRIKWPWPNGPFVLFLGLKGRRPESLAVF